VTPRRPLPFRVVLDHKKTRSLETLLAIEQAGKPRTWFSTERHARPAPWSSDSQSNRCAYRNTRRCPFSPSHASWCFLRLATLAGHREVQSTSSTIGRLLSCLSPISLPQYTTGYATVRASTKLCPWFRNGIVSHQKCSCFRGVTLHASNPDSDGDYSMDA